jgi:hypothetical protein
VDGVAAKIWKNFWVPKTRRAMTRTDSAHCCERGRKNNKLLERALVAERLHRYAGAGRRTLACEQEANAR